jgi:hypothetical protein
VALVRTDVLEERIASNIRVERIGELGTALAVTVVPTSLTLFILMMEAMRFSTTILTRATRGHAPKDGIVQQNLASPFTAHRFASIYQIFPALLAPGVYSASDGCIFFSLSLFTIAI